MHLFKGIGKDILYTVPKVHMSSPKKTHVKRETIIIAFHIDYINCFFFNTYISLKFCQKAKINFLTKTKSPWLFK